MVVLEKDLSLMYGIDARITCIPGWLDQDSVRCLPVCRKVVSYLFVRKSKQGAWNGEREAVRPVGGGCVEGALLMC